jgi:type I restriction enzyme R subunit
MEEYPTFYRKFSKVLEEAIAAFQEKRITDTEYLKKVQEAYEQVLSKGKSDLPANLPGTPSAGPIYNTIKAGIGEISLDDEILVAAVKKIDVRLIALAIVNFTNNSDIEKAMLNAVDDELYALNDANGLDLSTAQLDKICAECLSIMKSHHGGKA